MDYKIIIDNSQNNNTLTDYQVMVKITDPAFFSKCTEQKFVEFYDEDKQTLLNHYTEKFDTANNIAIFWVKVPQIPANGIKTIYLKINTSRTEDLSNPENVFDFWDDFEGDTLNTEKWTETRTGGGITVSNSVITLKDGARIDSIPTFGLSVVAEFKAKFPTWDSADGECLVGFRGEFEDKSTTDANAVYIFAFNGRTYFRLMSRKDSSESAIDTNKEADQEEHIFKIVRVDESKVKGQVDDTPEVEKTDYIPTVDLPITLETRPNYTETLECDWIRVRKYTEPEPTVSVIPTVATPTLEFKKRVAECIVTENCKINEADPKLELYDSGGNLIKTLSLADKHIFKDESNNRVVVQFLFVDDSSDSYTSTSQKLKFTKGGSEYVAFEASETLEKTADEPLPLRWEIYIPYTLDIELEGEY